MEKDKWDENVASFSVLNAMRRGDNTINDKKVVSFQLFSSNSEYRVDS